MSVVGRTYLERGEPVTVRAQWRSYNPAPVMKTNGDILIGTTARKSGPQNVLIERADGTLVVRPFRGLRKPSPDIGSGADD